MKQLRPTGGLRALRKSSCQCLILLCIGKQHCYCLWLISLRKKVLLKKAIVFFSLTEATHKPLHLQIRFIYKLQVHQQTSVTAMARLCSWWFNYRYDDYIQVKSLSILMPVKTLQGRWDDGVGSSNAPKNSTQPRCPHAQSHLKALTNRSWITLYSWH